MHEENPVLNMLLYPSNTFKGMFQPFSARRCCSPRRNMACKDWTGQSSLEKSFTQTQLQQAARKFARTCVVPRKTGNGCSMAWMRHSAEWMHSWCSGRPTWMGKTPWPAGWVTRRLLWGQTWIWETPCRRSGNSYRTIEWVTLLCQVFYGNDCTAAFGMPSFTTDFANCLKVAYMCLVLCGDDLQHLLCQISHWFCRLADDDMLLVFYGDCSIQSFVMPSFPTDFANWLKITYIHV